MRLKNLPLFSMSGGLPGLASKIYSNLTILPSSADKYAE